MSSRDDCTSLSTLVCERQLTRHEYDIEHRVISIPASESLQATGRALSTSLPQLDQALCRPSPTIPPIHQTVVASDSRQQGQKGIPCGHVTEVFGPPGTGKSSLAYVVRYLSCLKCVDAEFLY